MPIDMDHFTVEHKANEMLDKARLHIMLDMPFFGTILTRLPTMLSYYNTTAWTDGTRIGVNPYMVVGMSFEFVKGVICHEVLHVALKHHLRRGDRDPKVWNDAGDYVINAIIHDTPGVSLPNWTLLNLDEFADCMTEDVYSKLISQAPKKPNQPQAGNGQPGQGQPGQGSGQGSTGQGSGQPAQPMPGSKPDADGNPDDAGQMTEGYKNGSVNPMTGKGMAPGSIGEVLDFPGDPTKDGKPSASEVAAHEAELDATIRQAVTIATKRGKMNAKSAEQIKAAGETKTSWYDQLSQYMVDLNEDDYTWKRPAREFVAHDVYMPTLESEGLPPVLMSIDVSGSVTTDQLSQASREVIEIIDTFGCNILIIYHNTKVVGHQWVEAGDLDREHFTLNFKGTGGTSYIDVFNYIEQSDEVSEYLEDGIFALLMFTDCECDDYPGIEPEFPVIVCEFRDGPPSAYTHKPPAWADHVIIDLNQ